MTTRRAAEAGFTLAEVLVGLAITGLCAVLFVLAIGQVALAGQRGAARDAALNAVRDAQFLLATRIAGAQPQIDPQTASTIDLAGQADQLDFIAEPAGSEAPDALRRYRIALDPAGAVALYSASVLDSEIDAHDRDPRQWRKLALIDGAAALRFAYFGPDPVTQTPTWQRNWSRRPGLPLLVRVTVDFAEGDLRRWPDLVIRPRAATGDTCLRLARTGKCRGEA